MSSDQDRLHQTAPPASTSRYELLEKVASGGMATVYVGKLRGAEGFWRLVAIKRPHQHLLDDASFRRMFVEEARLASRIHHPHVVPVLDVEDRGGGQLLLVMDYIEGASLAELMDACASRGGAMPARVAVRIILDALAGLHAAHELTDAAGRQLRLVHRDVSPHNVLVGIDGTSRVADFGIAKSIVSKGVTESGVLKGKLAYMAPEYIERQECDARGDVFSMAIVAWEAIAGRRLFRGESDYDTLRKIVDEPAPPLSTAADWVGTALDAIIAAALDRDASRRTPTARAFGDALESAARRHDLVASTSEVGDFLRSAVSERLATRRDRLRRFLDAGGTTGPMEAALAAVAQATPIRTGAGLPEATAPTVRPAVSAPAIELTPSPPSAAFPSPRDELPPASQAVTSLGTDGTERALVAAGIRPRKRGGSTLFAVTAAVVVLAGVTAILIIKGGYRVDGSDPSASPVAPSGAGLATSGPTVAPVDVAPAPAPASAAPSASSSAVAPSSSAPAAPTNAVTRPRPTGASPPAPTAPVVAPPPPTEPAGPIRKNPYR